MLLHVSSTCVHHQEVKIALHSLWYHHTHRWPSRARAVYRSYSSCVWIWGSDTACDMAVNPSYSVRLVLIRAWLWTDPSPGVPRKSITALLHCQYIYIFFFVYDASSYLRHIAANGRIGKWWNVKYLERNWCRLIRELYRYLPGNQENLSGDWRFKSKTPGHTAQLLIHNGNRHSVCFPQCSVIHD